MGAPAGPTVGMGMELDMAVGLAVGMGTTAGMVMGMGMGMHMAAGMVVGMGMIGGMAVGMVVGMGVGTGCALVRSPAFQMPHGAVSDDGWFPRVPRVSRRFAGLLGWE